jgi:hypothetical protein
MARLHCQNGQNAYTFLQTLMQKRKKCAKDEGASQFLCGTNIGLPTHVDNHVHAGRGSARAMDKGWWTGAGCGHKNGVHCQL